jgi:hypothetical protein
VYDFNKIDSVASTLTQFEQFCAITLALKIADDSCKMNDYERSLFMALYDAMPKQTDVFDKSLFEIIKEARLNPTAQLYAKIKPLREDAMNTITKPNMKAFKASVREKLQK